MHALTRKYKVCFTDKNYLKSLVFALMIWAGSLIVNYYAGVLATSKASNSVTDIVLSNIPSYNVDLFFIYGPVIFWVMIFLVCARDPEKFPFVLKSIALFTVTRAFFINLTHIGPFPSREIINSKLMSDFTSGGDLFFSGHTGGAFLIALIFWKNVKLRYLFFLSSVFFGVIVLLGHLHYTIDVIGAFFITYSIYKIAEIAFPAEKKLFDGATQNQL